MGRAGHLSYLLLLAYLSIFDQSKAGCHDGLEGEFPTIFFKEHIPLVIVGNLTTSMYCTLENYSNSSTWKTHLQNRTEWSRFMKPILDCPNDSKNTYPYLENITCERNQTTQVPLFYFRCFVAEGFGHNLTDCGKFENIKDVYSKLHISNSGVLSPRITCENDVSVSRWLLVFSVILNFLLPTLVWLYMRWKERLPPEQKVILDDVL